MEFGNLQGTVVDDGGTALPSVTVRLSGSAGPEVQVTDAQGHFRLLALQPGKYHLQAKLEGFSTVEYPNVNINAGRNTNLEVKMTPANE